MAEEGGKGEGRGFKVEDRRRFSSQTGEAREETEKAASSAEQVESAPNEKEQASDQTLPEINFSTFIISLSTQVLMHLGEIPNPLTGKVETDVAVAKQMIDLISVLREKTQGNLDQGEETLVDDVLYDLRMRYVEMVKKR